MAPGIVIAAADVSDTVLAPASEAAPGVAIAAADVSDTALAPALAPMLEGAVAAAMDEVTSTAVAASAPKKTEDEQSDKEEVHVDNMAAAAGVPTAGVVSTNSLEGEKCDRELALDAPSTPHPAAGAEGVDMFTTPMQRLLIDDDHLLISRQENEDRLNNLGNLLMDLMSIDFRASEERMSIGIIEQMLSFLTDYANQQEIKQDDIRAVAKTELKTELAEFLQGLQKTFDERAEARLTQVKEGLTVHIDTAQQETGKRIEDLAGQASALSKRLDNNQAERIRKTKETILEQEHKVSRQLDFPR